MNDLYPGLKPIPKLRDKNDTTLTKDEVPV
jgi:hypothetical protein